MAIYCIKVFFTKDWGFNRLFILVLAVFAFYLFYSLAIGSNTKAAIFLDFGVQVKPYLGFFCAFSIAPQLNRNQKLILRQTVILLTLYMLCVGLVSFAERKVLYHLFSHVSRYATAISVLGMLYLYCSDYTKRDKFIFLLILALGLISGRSKFFGFYVICIFAVFFLKDSFRMRFNLKNTLYLLIAFAAVFLAAREKIFIYFVEGGFLGGRGETDLYARMALYYFSIPIFLAYFPFGSGFASYATYASGIYYSDLYVKYGMEGFHGLTKDDPAFVADAYYPALAQFGVAGVLLFFSFWIYLVRKAAKAFSAGFRKEAVIIWLIVIFFLIESTSDTTITHNRGFFMMMLMGLACADIYTSKEKNSISE
ncbi:MAG: O-antigen ligase domain-containing protein [Tannerellaceae bacterium]|nr:O-antigen ligase domain-containing protein [Tannerellaceae bacterium]